MHSRARSTEPSVILAIIDKEFSSLVVATTSQYSSWVPGADCGGHQQSSAAATAALSKKKGHPPLSAPLLTEQMVGN